MKLTGNKDVDNEIFSRLEINNILSLMPYINFSKDFWIRKIEYDFPLRSKNIQYSVYKDLHIKYPDFFYEIISHPSKIVSDINLLRRGDIFKKNSKDYRNKGKKIWDGQKLLNLEYIRDDYGTVPKEFTFPEFPFDHFHNSIAHNKIIWLSKESIEEAIKNYDNNTTYISDKYRSYMLTTNQFVSKEKFRKYILKRPYVEKTDKYYIGGDSPPKLVQI